ncbi:alpha/beta hydrolase [Companilactobacillus allii]|uniref:Esterase n=1 Tax=Companilactobacillus allii TaxID=1847728 RepID=A0A1P8Q5V8_9LACO|nr:alpha/beta hydrolase fold domain-containing protein [Companilactobacillus allii]APX73227.1 esterase [Companilactobacillus allii]USQ68038.1 alpha/beta hydrolase [Companilactobacillus allii]
MITSNYLTELNRLKLVEQVDVPRLEDVKMVIKDRVEAHSYEPNTWDEQKGILNNTKLSDDLTILRAGTKAQPIPEMQSQNICVDIHYSYEMGRKVRYFRIYNKKFKNNNRALLYMHGGAYYGGSVECSLNPLKLLATQFEGTIYSIDYGLAPEYPYPSGLFDCLAVLMEVAKNKHNIALAGDSAGGAMALGLTQIAHYMGICEIESQLLFYPTLVHGSNLEGGLWDDSRIPIIDQQRNVLHASYEIFKQLDKKMTELYLPEQDIELTSPILSPMYANPLLFKKVTVLTGEFDPLRLQNEAFIEKVGMAGADATYVRYGGMSHAFLNLMGKAAASEDAIYECAKRL